MNYEDFENWQNRKFTELAELFVEITPEIETKFNDFCWERFESERQQGDSVWEIPDE